MTATPLEAEVVVVGHLGAWARIHRPVLLAAAGLAVAGAALAPLRIAARAPDLAPGPTFSTAILMPALAATLAIYLALPLAAVAEATASRRMPVWRCLQAVVGLLVAVGLVLPAALVAKSDGVRIVQNLLVFTAVGVLVARATHPVAGIVVPWLWSFGALLFGLSYADLGGTKWAWWAWIIGDSPSLGLPVLACLTSIAVSTVLPLRFGAAR